MISAESPISASLASAAGPEWVTLVGILSFLLPKLHLRALPVSIPQMRSKNKKTAKVHVGGLGRSTLATAHPMASDLDGNSDQLQTAERGRGEIREQISGRAVQSERHLQDDRQRWHILAALDEAEHNLST